MKTYRDTGAQGALLDEYEKAVEELIDLIKTVSPTELTTVVDRQTKDPDCVSIQTILTHVVRAGYGYVNYIRRNLGETIDVIPGKSLSSTQAYELALRAMFASNVQLFEDYPHLQLEETEMTKKICTNWGQYYDPEQLLEHAIVHILRHRRQIERFLLRLRNT
jgi:uncharacterized damage-inducible protein DinB